MIKSGIELEYLEKIFKDNDFSNDQIARMLKKYNEYQKDVAKIKDTLPRFLSFIMGLGYKKEEAIELAIYRPLLLNRKFTVTGIKSDYYEYLDSLKDKKQEETKESIEDYRNLCDNVAFFRAFGFKESSILNWCSKKTKFAFQPVEKTKKVINYFLENLGFGTNDIIKSFNRTPSLFSSDVDRVKEVMDVLKQLDISLIEVGLIVRDGHISLNAIIDGIREKNLWLLKCGFNSKQIKSLFMDEGCLIGASLELFNDKRTKFLECGFNEEQFVIICCGCHSILTTTFENNKTKLDLLESYNFSREEVIEIVVDMPNILSNSLNSLSIKLDYLKQINMLQMFKEHPKNIIQSKELTELRYNHMTSLNKSEKEIKKSLFVSNKHFYSRYGVTKKDMQGE